MGVGFHARPWGGKRPRRALGFGVWVPEEAGWRSGHPASQPDRPVPRPAFGLPVAMECGIGLSRAEQVRQSLGRWRSSAGPAFTESIGPTKSTPMLHGCSVVGRHLTPAEGGSVDAQRLLKCCLP
jgi:hypothetical protein